MSNSTTNTTSEKAPGLQSEGSSNHTTNTVDSNGIDPNQTQLKLVFEPAKPSRKHGRKSTATEAQYERIDRMLSTGEKSTFDFRRAGIMAPAARIKEMNDKLGYYIPTIDQRDIYDEQGYLHKRVGVYELVNRPVQTGGAI